MGVCQGHGTGRADLESVCRVCPQHARETAHADLAAQGPPASQAGPSRRSAKDSVRDPTQLSHWRGQGCFVFGRRSIGSFDLRTGDGTRLTACAKACECTLIETAKTLLTERRAALPPGPVNGSGIRAA